MLDGIGQQYLKKNKTILKVKSICQSISVQTGISRYKRNWHFLLLLIRLFVCGASSFKVIGIGVESHLGMSDDVVATAAAGRLYSTLLTRNPLVDHKTWFDFYNYEGITRLRSSSSISFSRVRRAADSPSINRIGASLTQVLCMDVTCRLSRSALSQCAGRSIVGRLNNVSKWEDQDFTVRWPRL